MLEYAYAVLNLIALLFGNLAYEYTLNTFPAKINPLNLNYCYYYEIDACFTVYIDLFRYYSYDSFTSKFNKWIKPK